MQYRLRTLLIVLALGPMVLAWAWWKWSVIEEWLNPNLHDLTTIAGNSLVFNQRDLSVECPRLSYGKTHVTAASVLSVKELPNARRIIISNSVLDDGAKRLLRKAENVKEIVLSDVNIDDADLALFLAASECNFLNVAGTNITGVSVETIAAVTSLRSVALRNTALDRDDIVRLRMLRPDLQIDW